MCVKGLSYHDCVIRSNYYSTPVVLSKGVDPGMKRRPYLSGKRWRLLRRRILDRDGWRCRLCGKSGRLEVDHRRAEFAGGKRWDADNLQALCVGCHIQKTRKENSVKVMSADQKEWLDYNVQGLADSRVFSRFEQKLQQPKRKLKRRHPEPCCWFLVSLFCMIPDRHS